MNGCCNPLLSPVQPSKTVSPGSTIRRLGERPPGRCLLSDVRRLGPFHRRHGRSDCAERLVDHWPETKSSRSSTPLEPGISSLPLEATWKAWRQSVWRQDNREPGPSSRPVWHIPLTNAAHCPGADAGRCWPAASRRRGRHISCRRQSFPGPARWRDIAPPNDGRTSSSVLPFDFGEFSVQANDLRPGANWPIRPSQNKCIFIGFAVFDADQRQIAAAIPLRKVLVDRA